MSNPQNEPELLEGMIEVQRFMKGQFMFLYQALFALIEDLLSSAKIKEYFTV